MSDQTTLIDINSATRSELTSLPGIGPALADRIVAARPFQSVADLTGVSGIGASLLDEIRPRLTATETQESAQTEDRPQSGSNGSGQLEEVESETDLSIAEIVPAAEAPDIAAELEAEPTSLVSIPAHTLEVEAEQAEPEQASEEEAKLEAEPAAAGPVPAAVRAEPAAAARRKTPEKKYFSRGQVIWIAIATGLLTALLAVVISLGALVLTNGNLVYANPQDVLAVQRRVESLDATADILQQDIDGVRTRMENLEGLAGRVTGLESGLGQLEEDVDSAATQVAQLDEQVTTMEAQVEDLQASATMMDNFLSGLRNLLEELTLAEGAVNE